MEDIYLRLKVMNTMGAKLVGKYALINYWDLDVCSDLLTSGCTIGTEYFGLEKNWH